jgi:hypothetical protein
MEWTTFVSAAFALEHPVGWQVQTRPGPVTTVVSPNGEAFALIEAFAPAAGETPASVLSRLLFPSAALFLSPIREQVMPGPAGTFNMFLNYRMAVGGIGRARVACVPSGPMVTIFTSASRAEQFATIEPTLFRILMSFRPASAAPTAQQTPAAGTMQYVRFDDPQMGTFSVEAPVGWKLRGGLNHPGLGDRRPWVEAMSPDAIYILSGDPEFPQNFCHFRGNAEGAQIPQTGGALFLNLTPSADRIADHYLKNMAAKRFGAFTVQGRRPRPDVVKMVLDQCAQQGVKMTKNAKVWAVETLVQMNQAGQQRVGSLLVTAGFSGDYSMGMFTYWAGNVFLYIAPPALAPQAEAVRWRLIQSYKETPRMKQLVQQDEAMITQAGQAANAAQWNWFAGQQQFHQSQVAFGDAAVSNYWQQQRANDTMIRGWEHNQAINQQISEARSDQILDRQRLADDGMGKSYEAPSGYQNYWLDQQSGQIIGTNTSDPPDLTRNYTPLRRV